MKISKQVIVAIVILFGISVIANAKTKSKRRSKNRTKISKIYRLESCDCVGMKDGIPTFLSDFVDEPMIETQSRSLAKARKVADRMCYNDFRDFAKVKKTQVSSSGCKVFVSRAGSGTWKAL